VFKLFKLLNMFKRVDQQHMFKLLKPFKRVSTFEYVLTVSTV